ncbi:precorrin-2 dehydrogenase/sirohydrochlorin ferrochelatase family protein [Rossellomorea marisflavi]|uniref:precorrin-2 dehydrogenase/sirohydrochlorin ferrochelatase family protein n=1 Tax=Rossellomorea marisflavi TaxID=189381 RepID=UPI003D2EEA74
MLPLMLDVTGKKVIIAGGGRIALRKLSVFMNEGAVITVISPEASEEIQRLHEHGAIVWKRACIQKEDLKGAHFLIAATNDPSANEALHIMADASTWVCVASDGNKGNMQMMSFKREGDLTISVSTSGSSPGLANDLSGILMDRCKSIAKKLPFIRREREHIKNTLPSHERGEQIRLLLKELMK